MAIKFRRWKSLWEEYVILNWRYKLAALGSACVLWAYVAGQQSMQAVVSAPVFFQNIPAGTVVAGQDIIKIQVTVSGRRHRILDLKDRQIWVSVNLNGMTPGNKRYQITKKDLNVPAGIEVVAINPHQFYFQLRPDNQTPSHPPGK